MREGREQSPVSALEQLVRERGEKELLSGSHFEGSMKEWREQRATIADLLQEGTVLDVGCANGFLMACLKEWSGKDLDAYGVDTDPDMIEQARELFPDQSDHFVTNEDLQGREAFPQKFDNVYWNVWDNFELTSDEGRRYLEQLGMLVRDDDHPGHYVLGSYRPNREANLVRLQELEDLGWEVEQILDMADDRPEIVMLVKRKEHAEGNDGTID